MKYLLFVIVLFVSVRGFFYQCIGGYYYNEGEGCHICPEGHWCYADQRHECTNGYFQSLSGRS